MILGTALLALFSIAHPDTEVTRADGRTVTVTGDELLESGGIGTYRVVAEDGIVLVEGEVLDGAREGRWTYRYPNGEFMASGRYVEGVRHGKWRSGWRIGGKRSSGTFKRGVLKGKWTCYDLGGNRDGVMSGEIQVVEGVADGLFADLTYSMALLDGEPHGPCTARWDDGSLLYQGAYVRGVPVGDHLVCVYGGATVPGLTGPVGEDEWEPCPMLSEPDALGCIPGPAVPKGIDVATSVAGLEKLLSSWSAKDRKAARQAAGELLERGQSVSSSTLRAAARWAVAEVVDARRVDGVVEGTDALREALGILISALGGADPGWQVSESGDLVDSRHLPVLRAHARLALLAASAPYWALDARLHPAEPWSGGRVAPTLAEAIPVSAPWASWFDPAPKGKRSTRPMNRRRDKGRSRQKAIDEGLAWLSRNQRPDGSWSARWYSAEAAEHDVGVTALALMCFLQEGSTFEEGPHSECVAGALRFLLRKQTAKGGQIRSTWDGLDRDGRVVGYYSGKWIYDHALATWAISEAARVAQSPALRRAVHDAVAVLLKARNPYEAWGYEQNGHNDTSVTHWATRALASAQRLGITLDPAVADHVIAFVNEMTDSWNGRVGYDERGSNSSRYERRNDDYSVEHGEPLTACGMVIRELMGRDRDEAFDEVMGKHSALILRQPPRWDDWSNDMHYWMIASEALRGVPSKGAEAWYEALNAALIPNQNPGTNHPQLGGSWDPIGPWGYAGGRVYSTAMSILALGSDRCTWRVVD